MIQLHESLYPSFHVGDLLLHMGKVVGIVLEERGREIMVVYRKDFQPGTGESLVPGVWTFVGPIPAVWRTEVRRVI